MTVDDSVKPAPEANFSKTNVWTVFTSPKQPKESRPSTRSIFDDMTNIVDGSSNHHNSTYSTRKASGSRQLRNH